MSRVPAPRARPRPAVAEPRSSRPFMPGYGIVGPDEGRGLLPWAWAEERLARARYYWLATTSADSGPTVSPVWGVWVRQTVWFSSSPGSRKARNIAADARATITTDDPRQPVVVEGTVVTVSSRPDVEAFTALVNAKYESDIGVDFFLENACFCLEPRRVFGLDEADFSTSPTRWIFAVDEGR
jgi:hypothetical protein